MEIVRASKAKGLVEAAIASDILGEAEEDCSEHMHPVNVLYTCDPAANGHRTEVIAALLRVLAIYEDGFCAVRGAEDHDLAPPSRMLLRFRSAAKRSAFLASKNRYLDKDVRNCLSFTAPTAKKV